MTSFDILYAAFNNFSGVYGSENLKGLYIKKIKRDRYESWNEEWIKNHQMKFLGSNIKAITVFFQSF